MDNPGENNEEEQYQQDYSYSQDYTESDGWKLYYSEEGYPYYYNEYTGESQWADYSNWSSDQYGKDNSSEQYDQYYTSQSYNSPRPPYNTDYRASNPYNNLEADDEELEDSDEDDSSDDEEAERRFQEFLKTPEGQAAIEYEQERIERQLQKNLEKENIKKDKAYYDSLLVSNKKNDGEKAKDAAARPASVFTSLSAGFSTFLGNFGKKEVNQTQDPSNEHDNPKKLSKTKRKIVNPSNISVSTADVQIEVEDIENKQSDANSEQSPSRSSSSSDLISLSSDDSDLAVVNAPVFSEFSWLNVNTIYNNYINPTREFLDQSGITHNTQEAGNQILEGGRVVAIQVASATLAIATNVIQFSFQLLQGGITNFGNQLYPHLIAFLETVIDGSNTSTSPNASSNSTTNLSISDQMQPNPMNQSTTGDVHYTSSQTGQEENLYANQLSTVDRSVEIVDGTVDTEIRREEPVV